MKRLKKELSLLLAFALVLTSIAIGLGQLGTKAAADIMPGTGRFRVGIQVPKNGSNDGFGTDSSFQFKLTTDNYTVIGQTPANALWGDKRGDVDPLENNKTTQYYFPGLGYGGSPGVEVASLGTMNVNRNIERSLLVCTTFADDWKFDNVWFAYYYEDGANPAFNDFEKFGLSGSKLNDGADRKDSTKTYFGTTHKKEITFDANGGTGGKAYDIIRGQTIGNSASDLPTVTRTGYTLEGWYPNAAGTGTKLVAGTTRMPNSNQTYYAKWTPNTYTVAYNGNGSTGGSTASSSHTYGVARNLTTNGFTRTGHTFAGWNTAANGSGTNYTNGQSVSNLTATNGATVTLYAKWTTNNYNLTFNANGGTGGTGPTSTPYGSPITAPQVSRTGHTFSHWSPTVPATMPAAHSTYTAQWTVNSYNVTFAANGGSGTMAPQGILYGTSANLTANTFTRSGYKFTGWNTQANGQGTSYADKASYGPMGTSGVTLYAQWEKSDYDLIFNANGGSGTMTNQTIGVGATAAIKANTFTRTGYTFKNWNTLANGTGTTYANQANFTMGSSNTTLYAQWDINQYTITFNSDGGSAVAPITQNYGTAITTPANPTKAGHTFSGWSPTVPSTMPASNTTCTAQWTANQYTVSFVTNGGTALSPITKDYGTQISAPTAPTRTGYTFAGWYSNEGLTNAVSWPHTVAANVSFYAKWTPYTYTVAYNGNTSTGGSTASSSHTYGTAKALTTNGFSKTGHTFAGWNTAADGSGTGYSNGQSVTNLTTTNGATVTLYAQWTVNQYTISFDSDGGSAVSPITQNYGTTVTPPATPPTKAGFTFDGWLPAVPATMPAENTTCVAQWKANTYTVEYNANNATGGTVPSSHSHTIGGGSNNLASNSGSLARTGYSFAGWNTKADGTGTDYTAGASNVGDLSTTPNATVTLYAKWQGNAHTITFDANGGTGGETVNLNYGDPLTPPTVRRTGYAFQGWNPGVPATVDGDKTYVAQWAKTSVNVSLTEEGEIAVAITGYSLDYNYQIWTYQKITSDIILDDDPDIPANQWILSMGYTLGSDGDEEDNTLLFYVDQFTSPNENYTIALRIADENGDYLFELRDSYTPEDLNEAVITKVLVDGEYVKGSAQADGDGHSSTRVVKEIKPGATTTLKVVGNDAVTGYTATVYETGQELTVSN
ncbi:MAG: InlB B-repeat-containing protein, partial [Clostridiales bacterium]|nr:InlB B-repeat-containing protein [Clostridiales bacterium]